jgi:predicted 3-demethylubiquinone-9 3-methyltransferase (glyoxalase superfamily)
MQKITTFLWFRGEAEAAAKFYTSIFKKSKLGRISYYGDEFPDDLKGKVMLVEFKLEGQEFIALNGNADFKLTPAISLFVRCKTQREVDHFWNKLSKGGKEIQCGWVTDKFGVTWQIVPEILLKLIQDKDKVKAGRTMRAMMKMVKLDIAELKRAHGGK